MVASNDFVMTIEDDDQSFNIVEEEELENDDEIIEEKTQPESETSSSKKKRKAEDKKKEKKEKKKAKTTTKKNENNKDNEFDSGFTFAIDGGGSAGPSHAWDFTAAKSMLKEAQVRINKYLYIYSNMRCHLKNPKFTYKLTIFM